MAFLHDVCGCYGGYHGDALHCHGDRDVYLHGDHGNVHDHGDRGYRGDRGHRGDHGDCDVHWNDEGAHENDHGVQKNDWVVLHKNALDVLHRNVSDIQKNDHILQNVVDGSSREVVESHD